MSLHLFRGFLTLANFLFAKATFANMTNFIFKIKSCYILPRLLNLSLF